MKALVTYLSQTGNTKKIADAIFKELQCEKEIAAITGIKSLDGYDIIFAGFPIWQAAPAEPAVQFLDNLADGKNIALFVTHAMDYEMEKREDQELLETALEKSRACAARANLRGFFHCRGELAVNVAGFLLKSGDPVLRRFGKNRRDTIGHPDMDELEVARIFARDVMHNMCKPAGDH